MSPRSRTDPAAARRAGATVGKYRLLALAGQGGMGTVWKAEDTTLDRVVALKFLSETLALQPRARRRFVHEARAASRLTHPGIATVFEIAEIGGDLAIAIQWIEGDTVAERVERGPLPEVEALRIAREAASALAHAHAHGVLHRDVSARNLMVARTGEVLVLDFGLALPEGTSRLSSSGATIGTLAYLAPEIIVGQPAGARSDVYSLGVVLYEMLTGTRPFRAERPEAVLYAAINEPVVPPGEKCAGLRREVDALVLKAMARDPLERHEGAAAFAAALRQLESPDERRHDRVAPARTRRSPHSRGAAAATPGSADPGRCYVVVVPFEDVPSGADHDPKRELFAMGLTETVRAQLGRYPGVHVVAPSATAGAQVTSRGTRELAREVGADFVLRGSVQQSGARLRLTFELLDPLEGVQLASDVLDGTLDEVFSLQDLLVRHVAHALRPGLASVTAMADRAGLEPVAAQQRYLQAVGYLQRSDSEAQVDGALALLTELQASGHDSALVEAALGRACLYKYQLTHDPAWEQRAEEACSRAAALDPKSPDVHLTLGDVQRVSGRPAEAVRSFRRALRLRPDSPDALTGLARSLQAAGRVSDAEKVFRRAIALRPAFWEPYHLLGGLQFNQGRYDEAILLWRRVIELTPDNVRAHYNLGGALFRLERFDEAIEVLDRSIGIRPEATAYSNLGTVHYFLGHAEQSATMFEHAVALRPGVPRLWGNLGDAYRWLPGREADADAAYDRAIELIRGELEVNAHAAEGLAWLGVWLARRGQARAARREVEHALRAAPEDVNVMACAVTAFSAIGETALALQWLERALRAGYGLAEFERDPDLRLLRAEPGYSTIVRSFAAAAPARHTAPSGRGREEQDPRSGGAS